MVFNSPCLTDKKELIHYEGTALVYVVPTGKDNFIVSAGRPNMVPAGRTIVSPGSIIFGPGNCRACIRRESKSRPVNEGLGAHKVQGDEIVTWCARVTLFDAEIQGVIVGEFLSFGYGLMRVARVIRKSS
ncbi:hypothetical protein Tco_0565164 [Tanacetum coccineum]